MRTDELNRKFAKSIRAYDVYAQQLQSLTDRRNSIRKQVGQAKYRIKLKPEITAVLDDLRMRSHQRILGTMERLLTAALLDVMGDANCNVRLSLDTARGLPDLQFSIIRTYHGEQVEEDILHANGLSYSNVLSTALRVIAMESGRMRRFLLLDETDKHIAPDNVPYYVSMIKNLSNDFHTQVLMISHHSAENFVGCNVSRIKRIKPTDDDVEQVTLDIQNPYPEWTDKDVGIRSLHMMNFEAHADTTLYLSPRVSVLQGPNGLGKSSIHRALAALAGQSSDSIIRHFRDEAIVDAEVADGFVVRVSRHRTRNPKVIFSLFHKSDMQTPLKQENIARGTPDWVFDLLGLRTLNGIEVQLCWQGETFFLLDKTGSKAAELLSLGKESSYVKDMETAYKNWVTQDRQTIKQGEAILGQLDAQIASIRATLDGLRYLPDMESTLLALRDTEKKLEHVTQRMRYLPAYQHIGDDMDMDFLSTDILNQYSMEKQHSDIRIAHKVARGLNLYGFVRDATVHDISEHIPNLIVSHDGYAHAVHVGQLVYDYALTAQVQIPEIDSQFFDSDTAYGLLHMQQITDLMEKYMHVMEYKIPDYRLTLSEPPENAKLVEYLNQQFQSVLADEKDLAKATREESLAESQWLAWVSTHGGVCPACDQPFNVTQHTHPESSL